MPEFFALKRLQKVISHCQSGSEKFCAAGLLTVTSLLAGCAGNVQQEAAEPKVVQPPQVIDYSFTKIPEQKSWHDAVIYFVVLDRFADGNKDNNQKVDRQNVGGYYGGDFTGLKNQLDELADLGVTALWITPVVKQDDFEPWAQGPVGSGWETGFQHTGFHGYWAEDFTKVDPSFGTEETFKELVDAAHKRNMKIVLDVVYNHPGYDSDYEIEHPDWIRKETPSCDVDPVKCQVGGLPDFKTELPEVRRHVLDAHIGFAKRTGVDGFRMDTVKHVSHDFMQQHRKETYEALGDDFFLLGEVWGGNYRGLDEWFKNDEMNSGFDFTFKGSCQGFVEARGRTAAFARYLEKRHKVRDGYHLAHYLSSHDEPMMLYELDYDIPKFRLCVALQMTSLGIPVIYYGEEVAREGGDWPNNRDPMPWGKKDVEPGDGVERNEALRAWYSKLIDIRRSHPAFTVGTHKTISDLKDDLLVFLRHDEETGSTAVVAVNRRAEAAQMSVPAPKAFIGASVRELMEGNDATVENGLLKATIGGMSAQIFVVDPGTQK